MDTGCDSLATLIMNCRSPVVEEKLLHELLLLTECNRTSHSLSSMNMGGASPIKTKLLGP